ncbi:MAG: hypothetical protein ABJ356_10590 [Balneola sp.]
MNLNTKLEERKCENCESLIHNYLSKCEACNHATSPPNVYACSSEENIKELKERFNSTMKEAYNDDKLELVDLVDKELKDKVAVVVSMPPIILRNLVNNPSQIYSNYEKLVEGRLRTPANPEDDSKRGEVGSIIFGSYAREITYGILSHNEEGLPPYGHAFCKLKDITVKHRTTFMENNSYKVHNEQLLSKKIPLGLTSDWNHKEYLVLNKLYKYIKTNESVDEILVNTFQTDGLDRSNDNFIEAHIYGGFTKNSINSMKLHHNADRDDRRDFELAQHSMQG